jgi:hypothetical protein
MEVVGDMRFWRGREREKSARLGGGEWLLDDHPCSCHRQGKKGQGTRERYLTNSLSRGSLTLPPFFIPCWVASKDNLKAPRRRPVRRGGFVEPVKTGSLKRTSPQMGVGGGLLGGCCRGLFDPTKVRRNFRGSHPWRSRPLALSEEEDERQGSQGRQGNKRQGPPHSSLRESGLFQAIVILREAICVRETGGHSPRFASLIS